MNENRNWFQKIVDLNPAMVRAALVAVLAVAAQVVGHTVVDDSFVDQIINGFTALSALIAAIYIRPAVTPNAKVLAYLPDPEDHPTQIASGDATVPQNNEVVAQDVLNAVYQQAA